MNTRRKLLWLSTIGFHRQHPLSFPRRTMQSHPQPGILADVPQAARYLTFRLRPTASAESLKQALADLELDGRTVLGLGADALSRMNAKIPAMHEFKALRGDGVEMPATPAALWLCLQGEDRGELLHRGRALVRQLENDFELERVTDAFRYGSGRDLTGYEDGTENPTGDDAQRVAFVAGSGSGMDGSSFVAVQHWQHDLDAFGQLSAEGRDHVIGRRIADNEEIEDAPASAHVKRTAQEDFEPEAFVVRRSMPWTEGGREGLEFVAYAASFDPFEALARRMLGLDDGIVDALLGISSATTGSNYWCPPLLGTRLDLRVLAG